MHVTLKFEEANLTPKQEKKVPHYVKEKLKEFLHIDGSRLIVESMKTKESVDPVHIQILRKYPDQEMYDPSLKKMAINLADHVCNKKLEIDLDHGVKVVAYKADIAGKMFADFEGIEMVDFKKYDVDNVSAGILKPVTHAIFLITYNKQKYLASFEYVRAITCLGEIHSADLIPLSMLQMKEQVDSFVQLYKDKVERNIERIKNTSALLRYDGDKPENRKDNELHLAKIIAEFIEAHPDDVVTL